jgi:glycosyltransferase involved in cell wall biosynthesis
LQVIYHCDALAGPTPYGLARYAGELAGALARLDPALQLTPIALRGRLEQLRRSAVGGNAKLICAGATGKLLMASWFALRAPRIERWAREASLVHTLELDYPVATRLPWLATVHDLGPLTHPQYFSRSRPGLRRAGLRQLVRQAAAVIAVSEATAGELRQLVGSALDNRLQVVPEGVSEAFFAAAPDAVTAVPALAALDGSPYFLWTGSLNPRKNLAGVLAAFETIAGVVPHHLVLAGGLGWDHREILARIRESTAAPRIHRLGHVSDTQMHALYAGADAFVYASHFEGFGLPVLEAMAAGAPTITSNCSSLPEVAGDAALLVDPRDTAALAGAMRELARDDALRRDLSLRGRARASGFTWARCARATLEIYRRIA